MLQVIILMLSLCSKMHFRVGSTWSQTCKRVAQPDHWINLETVPRGLRIWLSVRRHQLASNLWNVLLDNLRFQLPAFQF